MRCWPFHREGGIGPKSITRTSEMAKYNSRVRAILAYWLKCTCSCQSRVKGKVVSQRQRANTQDRESLTAAWQEIPWTKVHRHVFRLQKRIYQATQRGDVGTVRKLQNLLSKSWYARLLAVRQVTQDNRGRHTAGIDGVKSL